MQVGPATVAAVPFATRARRRGALIAVVVAVEAAGCGSGRAAASSASPLLAKSVSKDCSGLMIRVLRMSGIFLQGLL